MIKKTDQPAINILPVDKADLPLSVTPLERMKKTWVGRLYLKHLKSLPAFRWIFINAWHLLLPLWIVIVVVYFGPKASIGWRRVIKMKDFVAVQHIKTREIFGSVRVETHLPQVRPIDDAKFLQAPHEHYVFPPVYVAELDSAIVCGGSNLVYWNSTVICHDLYRFQYDYTSEEFHGRQLIDAKANRIRLLCQDLTPLNMACAASFVDACAGNYAHWLTEVLPRIAIFCEIEEYANVPILVDEGLHSNIMQSLALVVGSQRPVFTLPAGRSIKVKRLIQTSATGYIPFGRRNKGLEGHSHGEFNPIAFEVLNKRLDKNIKKDKDQLGKIYLKRSSGYRNLLNSQEVEAVLAKKGYLAIDPCDLDFIEQLNCIRGATHVVAATGAALANLVFNKKNSNVVVLMGKHSDMSYRYWVNMLQPLGLNVKYVLGDQLNKLERSVHEDFLIDPEAVGEFA